jgi:predicted Rossmann fold flavoprotein
MKKIVIIGGGAAGMMCAASLAERIQSGELPKETQVTLVERNPYLGAKVIISGGGRCNVTTGVEDLKEVLKAYPRGAKFLKHAFYEFPPKAMMQWVEDHGVPLKMESDLRVFPKSDNGKDIVGIFEQILASNSNLKVLCKRVVTKVKQFKQGFLVQLNTDETLEADVLVLTTGGKAYRKTGSKGDGYTFAEVFAHTTTKLGASLNAFVTDEKWTKSLSGTSFENVKLRFIPPSISQEKFLSKTKDKKKIEFSGPMLITHKGITGPAVFALSSLSAFESFDKENPATIQIDFFPDVNEDQLRTELKRLLGISPKKQLQNVLALLRNSVDHSVTPEESSRPLTQAFAKALITQAQIPDHKRCNEISKKEFNKLMTTLKSLKLTAISQSPGDEFVTAGGIPQTEVDQKTMQSKLMPGLYFAGEILNIDGFTGGYNLHAAWSTGRLAGKSIT